MGTSRSSRPYLLRAFYEWIVDNHATPYVVVNADLPGVSVPQEYVENGRIVLNISPGAVRDLVLANDHIAFSARFSGIPTDIYIPLRAVSAIYAKENGRGMVFKEEGPDDEFPPHEDDDKGGGPGNSGPSGKKGKGNDGNRPKLTIVK